MGHWKMPPETLDVGWMRKLNGVLAAPEGPPCQQGEGAVLGYFAASKSMRGLVDPAPVRDFELALGLAGKLVPQRGRANPRP
eukprot:7986410-Pyramimonas_sp.AAC.1